MLFATLLMALPGRLTVQAEDVPIASPATSEDTAGLVTAGEKAKLLSSILALGSPCAYEVEFNRAIVSKDTPLGKWLIQVLDVGTDSEPSYRTVREAVSPFGGDAGDRVGSIGATERTDRIDWSPTRTFAIVYGPERIMQSAIAAPEFPAILRTDVAEVAYFALEHRLDCQEPTSSLALLVPWFVLDPLPVTRQKADTLGQFRWSKQTRPETEIYSLARDASKADDIIISCTRDDAKLPRACWWQPRSGRVIVGFYEFETHEGQVVLAASLRVREAGAQLEVTHYEFNKLTYRLRDSDITLTIPQPTRIVDRRDPRTARTVALAHIPQPWRALIRIEGDSESQPR